MKKGDLVIVEREDFRQSVLDFRNKWVTAMAMETVTVTVTEMGMATGTVTVTEMATATVPATAMATGMVTAINKKTGRKMNLKYFGSDWKKIPNQMVGIVTQITKEEHRDFDVIHITERSGQKRIFRRMVLENCLTGRK